jgi:hypothetical protein
MVGVGLIVLALALQWLRPADPAVASRRIQ